MTDYTVISKYRNKEQCRYLIDKLREKGRTCYSFLDEPADPNNPDGQAEEQMQVFENTKDFFNDKYFKKLFEKDLKGLKNARQVIMLLPAGNSTHMEAGIAYGLGKKLILIGEPEKPESLYLSFDEVYGSIDEFLETIRNN
jgi:nucleoside 2-deoxyribosyltransferase